MQKNREPRSRFNFAPARGPILKTAGSTAETMRKVGEMAHSWDFSHAARGRDVFVIFMMGGESRACG